MKRILLALGLSALTLVGGHFHNRRWDRAALFFVVLVLWAFGVYVFAMMRLSDVGRGQVVSDLFSFHWKVFLFGVVTLWVVSLVITFLDSRRAETFSSQRRTVSGVVGAVGLSLLTFTLLVVPVLPFLIITGLYFYESSGLRPSSSSRSTSTRSSYRDTHFSNYVYLGRISGDWRDFAKPPSGDGLLRGRFVYGGKPARGVRLSLVLNGKYETEELTTDESGVFTVRLPNGDWTVSRLVTHEWVDGPEKDDFIIISGTEPKLSGGAYNQHYWLEREGVKIAVTDQSSEPQLSFTIRQRITMTWPKNDEQPTSTKRADGVIAWDSYPGAETYLLRITELKREGRRTSFFPIMARPITGSTTFALAGLPAVPGDEQKEYQVSVQAFAKDGTFLSESSEGFEKMTFVLADNEQFVRDEERVVAGGNVSAAKIQELRENSRRLDAVEVLVKDGLLDEAEKLLAKVKGQADGGKKAAIEGYLMAKRGRCAEANKLFAQALSEGGKSCIPDCYRAECKQ